jgi:nuclear pore complex protein Nup133
MINNTKDITDAEINDTLLQTTVGWTFRGLCRMMGKFVARPEYYTVTNASPAEDRNATQIWPKSLHDFLGAGATHGELCVRFSAEDLRVPIIKDNVFDDDILHEHLEKHRFGEWFAAACRAGKKSFEDEARALGLLPPAPALPDLAMNGVLPEEQKENSQTASKIVNGHVDTGGRVQDVDMADS